MNKNKFIILILGLVILGGGIFFAKGGNSGKKEVDAKIPSASQQGARGMKCIQLQGEGDAGTMELVVYYSGDQTRYDMKVNHEEGGTKEMHGIMKGGVTYLWGDMLSIPGMEGNGFIVKDGEDGLGEEFIPADIEAMKEGVKIPGIQCGEWTPDSQYFQTPEGMNFVPMEDAFNPGKLMEQGIGLEPGAGMPALLGLEENCEESCSWATNPSGHDNCIARCELEKKGFDTTEVEQYLTKEDCETRGGKVMNILSEEPEGKVVGTVSGLRCPCVCVVE